MYPAHQTIARCRHEEHPGYHATGVIHPERGAKSKGLGEIFEACILQDRKRVTGKDFEHHYCNEWHHEQGNSLACTVIDYVNGCRNRALPGRHILWRLTRGLGTTLRNQFVRNLEIFWIYLFFSHTPSPRLCLCPFWALIIYTGPRPLWKLRSEASMGLATKSFFT